MPLYDGDTTEKPVAVINILFVPELKETSASLAFADSDLDPESLDPSTPLILSNICQGPVVPLEVLLTNNH
jgi:hypothetical protein